MEYDEDVIGITFADLELAESGTELYFTGMALETGVWTDKHGTTVFHPLDVIHRASHMFMGVQVLCRHNAGKVGEITEVINTQNGMKVRGVLSHPESIQLVLNKTLRGLSVGMRMKIDPVKRILVDIVLAREISLVERPACRVCVLDNGLEIKVENSDSDSESPISQSRGDAMIDEQIKYDEAPDISLAEQEPEEYPMPDCEEFKDDVEKYEACQEFSESVSLFRKAQDIWRAIFPKEEEEDEDMDTQNEDTNMTESKPATETKTEAEIVEKVELSQTETVVDVEAEAEVVTEVEVEAEANVETIEVEVEAETEVEIEVEAEAEVKPEIETKVKVEAEAEVEVKEVEVEQSAEVLELTAELSEIKQLLEDSATELTSAQVQLAETAAELSITKSQLKTIEDKTRSELVESVMTADPNADTELIDNMSNVQLEAYKDTVTRLSKPKVGSVRKTVNATEKSVEMSSPTTEGDEFITGVIGYLKDRQ